MWKIIKNIFIKHKCVMHDWALHKQTYYNFRKHTIYVCLKCGKIKHIKEL